MPCRGCRTLSMALCLLLALPVHAQQLTVFAAASLTDVLPALAERYAQAGSDRVRFSFAASSALARQLEAGASADVFVSADELWMDYAVEKGVTLPDTRVVLASNRLVLVAGTGSTQGPVTVDRELPLSALLGDGRLALGDPAHVPAGRYAQQALESLGLWSGVAQRLAPAESVRVALMYVVRGETPLGVVYATDARGVDGVRVVGEFPAASHAPVRYPAAVVASSAVPAAARAFLTWLRGPAAQSVWRRYGFTGPPDP